MDDIVGQPAAVTELKDFKNSILFKDIYSFWKINPPKGILFEGPPGTGKTACVRALANELKDICTFMEISSIDIASRYMDAPIEKLREMFKFAENLSINKHVVIFIDEIDSMLPSRLNQLHEVSIKRVNAFLEWMDGGLSPLSGITVIGATNNLTGIDEAFLRPGRFERVITFLKLNSDSIIEGLKLYLNKKKLLPSLIGKINWNSIKSYIENVKLSGAEIKGIIDSVVSHKAAEHIINIKNKINPKDNLTSYLKFGTIKPELFPTPIDTKSIIQAIALVTSKQSEFVKSDYKIGFSIPIS